MAERVVIPASLAGERLDRVVALLSGRPRSEVSELIVSGAVRVGGAAAARHRRLAAGEVLEFELPPEAAKSSPRPDDSVPFVVVYEDDDLIVVDKPAGVVVHPGAGRREGTLVSGLLARYGELGELAQAGAWSSERPGLVHRLDKGTSGLLVVARSAAAHRDLSAQLERRTMGRRYEALVLGELSAEEGTIDAPLGRSLRDPTKVALRADGRPARTHYRVLERFSATLPSTRIEARLETGRTHQIRVHLAAIGHPVAADSRYGGSSPALDLSRPFLHAGALRLVHPRTGEELEFTSPLSSDLVAVLAALRAGEQA